jgi:integrase
MSNTTNAKSSRDWGIIQKKEKGVLVWYARITRFDGNGKKKQYTAKADNKTHARRLRDELDAKYNRRGEKAVDGDKMTFRKLADIYKQRKLIAAEYHGAEEAQRKVAGVRSLAPVLHYCNVLREHFGAYLLKNISHADIEDFKAKRLKTKSKRGERSIADVNRTLALMRSILRFAIQSGWLYQSPFDLGKPLVSIADEVKRERTLSRQEENRFLEVCTGKREIEYERNGKKVKAQLKGGRELIKALVITALDTAMRKGELLKLRWKDVNLTSRIITITALNSKTAKPREIGMTQRVYEELLRLWEISPKEEGLLIFGISDIKKSFASVCLDAKIDGLRFHDLRHTAITRMVNSGIPPMEIMKVSGHTQYSTFARYVNPNTDSVKRIADVLSTYNTNENFRVTKEDKTDENDNFIT